MSRRQIGMQELLQAEDEALQRGGPKGSTGVVWAVLGMVGGLGLAGAVLLLNAGGEEATPAQVVATATPPSAPEPAREQVDPALLAQKEVPWLEYQPTSSSRSRARLAQDRSPLLTDEDLGRYRQVAPQAAPVQTRVAAPEQVPAVAEPTVIAEVPVAVVEQPAPAPAPTSLASAPSQNPTLDRRADEIASAAVCVARAEAIASSLVLFYPPSTSQPAGDDMVFVRSLAGFVNECPQLTVAVEGHSDSLGDDYGNMMLSWERAENVITALAQSGFDTSQFQPIGYGSRFPFAEGDASESEQDLNRRVQFRVSVRGN